MSEAPPPPRPHRGRLQLALCAVL